MTVISTKPFQGFGAFFLPGLLEAVKLFFLIELILYLGTANTDQLVLGKMLNYIQSIKEGDHISFEIVFKLWHKKVYAYFFKKTASGDQAKELTQMAFIKLWNFKHTLSEDHPLDLQLFKIAKTTLLDYFRKLANDERNLKLYYHKASEDVVEQDQSFDTKEQLDLVLNLLPPTRKKVFVLNRLHGYSYKEISEQLSISPRTVEKHISLAMKQLHGYSSIPAIIFLIRFFQ